MSDMSDQLNASSAASEISAASGPNLDMLSGVSIRLSVEVGSASLKLSELMSLNKGAVVELDRQTNDPLDIFANGTLIAKGEIVNVDGRFGIRLTQIVQNDHGIDSIERRQ